jgi:predicted phosphoribosyltransferase
MLVDRREAGRLLAKKLQPYASRPDVVVLALPRGGVPVAYEVAQALKAPLDVFVVRKLGLPGHEEFAIGAIASGGLRFHNRLMMEAYSIPERAVSQIEEREERELARREQAYRGGEPPLDVSRRTVILVDDGLATGASMNAAVVALRQARPARIVAAIPVAPPDTCEALRSVADSVVCAMTPEPFLAVGRWYENFEQTTDEEVKRLLALARARNLDWRARSPAAKAQQR